MRFFFWLALLAAVPPCAAQPRAAQSRAAQSRATLSGHVRDAATGETLSGATISVDTLSAGAMTNAYGYYAISLPTGWHRVQVRYVGYAPVDTSITLESDVRFDADLVAHSIHLGELVVAAETADGGIRHEDTGSFRLQPELVKALPALGGEVDPLKTLQLLPGVQAVSDGSSSFTVRGGNADQNLILLDEATVYNPDHLLGFFSTFNPDALKSVDFMRGYVPARYGGRLASVTDLRMKEGNQKKRAVTGGIGLLAGRLSYEMPLREDRGALIVSGRRSFMDLIVRHSSDEAIGNNRVYFYDLNAKANYRISNASRLYVSGYLGRDRFQFGPDFRQSWGNTTLTARWNYLFNDRLFSNTSVIVSEFDYGTTLGDQGAVSRFRSRIHDVSVKFDGSWFPRSRFTVHFGSHVSMQRFDTGEVDPEEGGMFTERALPRRRALDIALYAETAYRIAGGLYLDAGLRVGNFHLVGPYDEFVFDDPVAPHPTDTVRYRDGVTYEEYFRAEPRLGLTYELDERQTLAFAYARMTQNVHRLSNSTAALPTDLWLPSSLTIRPEAADLWSLNYDRTFARPALALSLEAYYKRMYDQVGFRDGAELFTNPFVERELVFGEGRAWGAEVMLQKQRGRTTGWLSYALAWSERRFDAIDGGNWFPARSDRRHTLTSTVQHQLAGRWALALSWRYHTGRPVTLPAGKVGLDGQDLAFYTRRHGGRMPAYHRLDVSLTWDKSASSSWTLAVNNAYARQNPVGYQFRRDGDDPARTEVVQIYFFSIVPSLTYNFQF